MEGFVLYFHTKIQISLCSKENSEPQKLKFEEPSILRFYFKALLTPQLNSSKIIVKKCSSDVK